MEGSCRDDIETRSHSVNYTCYCICVDPIVPQTKTHLFINTRLPISDNCFMNRWRHLMKYALLTIVFIIATRRHDFLHNIPIISCSLNIQCKRIWQAIYSGTRCYKTMFGSKSTKIKIMIHSYYSYCGLANPQFCCDTNYFIHDTLTGCCCIYSL